jgi:hypothetical protein
LGEGLGVRAKVYFSNTLLGVGSWEVTKIYAPIPNPQVGSFKIDSYSIADFRLF